MKKIFLPVFFCCVLFTSTFVTAYSKVSKNGQARVSSEDIVFTVSPVYVTKSTTIELKPGEVINHPLMSKYSTIDEELLAKLEGLKSRSKPQERFHPPVSFEHVLSHSNALRQQTLNTGSINSQSNNDVIYSKPFVSMIYDYPSNIDSKLKIMSTNPLSSSNSFPQTKFPEVYVSSSNNNSPIHLSEYDSKLPSFYFDRPPKSVEFPGHYDQALEVPIYAQDPNHDEVIYNHISDDHHFKHYYYHQTTTTEEPEMMDQRVNKRPYSYYYIGKKLWYIPLYFSIYFIIYVAALVLKSIARHKINFPVNLAVAVNNGRSTNLDYQNSTEWINYITKVLESIEKYGKIS